MISAFLLFGTLIGSAFGEIPFGRPPAGDRTYTSKAIDGLIAKLSPLLIDTNISILFENTLPNSLDTTILYHTEDPLDSFVITGDIEALWLRDSANQLIPYVPYAPGDASLMSLFEGLIARHARSVLIDPFANAFNYNASGDGWQSDSRKPPMGPAVYEGKYEIDSLAAFLKLSYWYWRYTKRSEIFTQEWFDGITTAVETIRTMQEDDGQTASPPYLFSRMTTVSTDTLMMSGRGPPAKVNGLSRSLFRPSDDGVTLPFNIPGNAMACTELLHVKDMLSGDKAIAAAGALDVDLDDVVKLLSSVSDGICSALDVLIEKASSAQDGSHAGVLPYEIDGYDSSYFMDDANVPSLLSLPVLGYMPRSSAIYQKTRDFVLSNRNPFYYGGKEGEGIGGPHEGYNMAWPMAIINQAMTSDSDSEVAACLNELVRSADGTGFMHEAFNVNDMHDYTRSWFAWANGLFGELILQLVLEKPHLVVKPDHIEEAQKLVQPPVTMIAEQEAVVKM